MRGGNGVAIPPPVVLGTPTALPTATPTATSVPGTTPTAIATANPNGPLTSTGTYAPILTFPSVEAQSIGANAGNAMSLTGFVQLPNSVQAVRFRVAVIAPTNGTLNVGQAYNATPDTFSSTTVPQLIPNHASVVYSGPSDVIGGPTWNASSGTVTISQYTRGGVGTGLPGQFQVQLRNVQMVPAPSAVTDAGTGTFVLNGTFTATSGIVS